jgi:hypothetical protein
LREPNALVLKNGNRIEVPVCPLLSCQTKVTNLVEIKPAGAGVIVHAAGDEQAKLGVIPNQSQRRLTQGAGRQLVIGTKQLDARLHGADLTPQGPMRQAFRNAHAGANSRAGISRLDSCSMGAFFSPSMN